MVTTQSRRPVILLALGFAVLAIAVLVAYRATVLQERANDWVRHTLRVQAQISDVGRMVTLAETGQRGYLLTGDQSYLVPFNSARTDLPGLLRSLAAATSDNPPQVVAATQLRQLVSTRMEVLDMGVQLMMAGKKDEAADLLRSGRGHSVMLEFSDVLQRMLHEEERLLDYRSALATQRNMIARTMLALSFVFAVVLAVFAVRGMKLRIDELGATVERLNAESAARNQAQGQVQQLQKMDAIGQLTGGIAHDFNNMLAIIMGSLDLARRRLRDHDPGNVVAMLDNAQEGADRAAALTAQLLAFARRQPLEPKTIEANKLVSGISELLRRTLGEQVQIETVLAGGLWRVHADPEQLESALVNLAVNARDAMPEGGKLTIETANSELDERYAGQHEDVRPGQYVMISVTDTGVGMAIEVIEQAFEPFFTTKEVGRGTGLGLSQVFGFVKQSAGHVKIYSEPGEGTTVKIYLPRYLGDSVPLTNSRLSEGLPLGKPGDLILVVEDEPRVRRMSVDSLIELGYGVIEASDGNEALGILAANSGIKLLFTDIVMPGMSGRALADRAVELRPGLKILYTTGYTRNATVHNGVVD